MNKKQAVEEVYQKGKLLSFENPEYFRQVGDFISTALREDVGEGDVTTQTVIPADLEMRAVINSKEKGVFCGQQELKFLYKSQNVRLKFLVDDGQEIACFFVRAWRLSSRNSNLRAKSWRQVDLHP